MSYGEGISTSGSGSDRVRETLGSSSAPLDARTTAALSVAVGLLQPEKPALVLGDHPEPVAALLEEMGFPVGSLAAALGKVNREEDSRVRLSRLKLQRIEGLNGPREASRIPESLIVFGACR